MNDPGSTSMGRVRAATRPLLVATLAFVTLSGTRGTVSNHVVAPATYQTTQSAAKPNASIVEAAIPFDLVNNHVVVKVRVNNSRPLSFVLDTGDQYAIINLDTAKGLGLKLHGEVRVGGAGAQMTTGAFVDGASFVFPAFPGFIQPVTLALPIGHLSSRLGQDFDGIIGSEFIRQFVVKLDYQAHVIELLDKTKFSYTGPGESIPARLDHGHPILEAVVTPVGGEAIKGTFVFDIGAGLALALYSPFVRAHGLPGSDLKTIQSLGGLGAGGETTGRFGRVSELKFGGFAINSPITLFSEDKEGAFANASLAGNIGARVAMRFRLYFDYDHDRIIFEPNSRFGKPFDYAFSGAKIVAEGENYRAFRVLDVLTDSSASEAGLQKDDVITAINGRSASELTLSDLNQMFEQVVAYKITIRRGTQVLQLKLTPRRSI
jgi:Aspartyl protease/PDZ domain